MCAKEYRRMITHHYSQTDCGYRRYPTSHCANFGPTLNNTSEIRIREHMGNKTLEVKSISKKIHTLDDNIWVSRPGDGIRARRCIGRNKKAQTPLNDRVVRFN